MSIIVNTLRTVVAFVLLITVVVAVHEFAHLLTAVAFGATVESFSIGFGPELFGFEAGGIYWQVSAIPLGGYVTFPVEAGPGIVLLESLSASARIDIMLSGVVMNAALAAAIAFILRKKYKGNTHQYTMPLNMKGFLVVPFIRNAGVTLKAGQRYFWWFVASTSVDLMLFNALFILPLDGGKIYATLMTEVFGLQMSFSGLFFSGIAVSFLVLMPLYFKVFKPFLAYVCHTSVVNDQHTTENT